MTGTATRGQPRRINVFEEHNHSAHTRPTNAANNHINAAKNEPTPNHTPTNTPKTGLDKQSSFRDDPSVAFAGRELRRRGQTPTVAFAGRELRRRGHP
jgi:hypothetical protein